jgi:hypothetical protein
MQKLWTGHKMYPVALTLKVGDRLLRMTHCLIIVNNCGKYLQNPFKEKNGPDTTYTLK